MKGYCCFFTVVAIMSSIPIVAEAQFTAEKASKSSVVKRMPGFTENDIYNIEKIEKALLGSTVEHIYYMHTEYAGSHRGIYRPTPDHIDDVLGIITTLGRSGYMTIWDDVFPYSEWRTRGIDLENYEPFIIWSVGRGFMQIVTLDGAVYSKVQIQTQRPTFFQGLPEKNNRPDPMHVNWLTSGDIRFLENSGLIENGAVARLQKLRDSVNKCSQKAWDGFERQFDAIEMAAIPWQAREARLDNLAGKARTTASRRCKRHTTAFEKAIKGYFSTYLNRRENINVSVQKRTANMPIISSEGQGQGVTYSGTINNTQGDTHIHVGTPCNVRVTHSNNSYNCRIRVFCGGKTLYGRGSSGYNNCTFTKNSGFQSVEAHDRGWSSEDRDPRMDLQTATKTLTVSDRDSQGSPWTINIILAN